MLPDSSVSRIKQGVSELSCEYFNGLKSTRRSLAEHFVQVARKNWRRRCISDSTGKQRGPQTHSFAPGVPLTYAEALISSIMLADRIAKKTEGQDKIGILLPPCVGGALANLAVTMLGKVAVNISYVGSQQVRQSAIEQCGAGCIISSRSFVERLGNVGDLPGSVFLEDIIGGIKRGAKLKAYLKARFMPRRFLSNARNFHADDLATVIFSSGTSGQPKGVMLSHHNVLSNIEALRAVFQINSDDNLCGVLPFFHSFGFTCTLWLPLVSGVSASYVANPLESGLVGRSVRRDGSTILFATPTFLLNYIRRIQREDFATLRAVVVGAEKLKKRVADTFEEKFGIRPLGGYGATELSPVVSLNVPDVKIGGAPQTQKGHPKNAFGDGLPKC